MIKVIVSYFSRQYTPIVNDSLVIINKKMYEKINVFDTINNKIHLINIKRSLSDLCCVLFIKNVAWKRLL